MSAVLFSGLTGCTELGPITYPVRGKITSQDGKPWAGGMVNFKSARDPGMLATGEIQADGSFILTTYYVEAGRAKTKLGAVAGEHTVTIVEPGPPEGQGRVNRVKPIILARKYHIEAEDNSLTIEIPKPGKP
jgi:hypothetical protein